MMAIVMKIFFFIVIVPYLMLEDGIAKLNIFLRERGVRHEVDLLQAALVGLIILLIILVANGFRW
jgi:hypothetical protein